MSTPTTSNSKSKVLMVEDDAVIRATAQEYLEHAGFEFLGAEDGRAGLVAYGAQQPDLVILDVRLPQIDGFEVCAIIREVLGGEHVPILIMTALNDAGSINRAYEVGATDFITKPLAWPILSHRARYMIRAGKAMEESAHTISDLNRTRASLAKAQRIARLGNWELDAESYTISGSDEMYRILGLTPDGGHSSLKSFLECVCEKHRERVKAWLFHTLQTGEASELTHDVVSTDGTRRTVYQQVETIVDSAGKTTHIYGTLQDITKQQIEESARQLGQSSSFPSIRAVKAE